MKKTSSLFVLLSVLAIAPAVHADNASAQREFEQGTSSFERRDFREAAAHFERAFAIAPRGAAMLNAGLSWDGAGDRPRAADALAKALARADLRPAEAAHAQKRLDELKRELGIIEIAAPAGGRVTVAHVEGAMVPVRVFITPGTHVIEVTTSAGIATRKVSVSAGAEQRVSLDEPKAAPSGLSTTPGGAKEGPKSEGSSQRTWGLVLGGTGVVFAGAAVGLGLAALSARDDFIDGGETNAEVRDRAATFRVLTNVSWGLAAATGVAGAVLFFTAPSGKGSSVQGLIGPGSVGLRARF